MMGSVGLMWITGVASALRGSIAWTGSVGDMSTGEPPRRVLVEMHEKEYFLWKTAQCPKKGMSS
jgi:hypothetical protein